MGVFAAEGEEVCVEGVFCEGGQADGCDGGDIGQGCCSEFHFDWCLWRLVKCLV